MKLIISILLVLSFNSHASLIQVSYEDDNFERAESISQIFQTNYDIPEELISIKEIKNCEDLEVDLIGLSLCINKRRQLVWNDSTNLELTKRTILSFTEKLGENYDY